MVKQLAIFGACFFLAILLNSVFQTVCQQFLGVNVNGETRCRLTQPLNGTVYLVLILVVSLALFAAWSKRSDKKHK